MDEEQQKHQEELTSWKTEAKAAQDKVCIEGIYYTVVQRYQFYSRVIKTNILRTGVASV